MSTKSKSSGSKSGCCSRKLNLNIKTFTQELQGFGGSIGDPFGPVQPSGLTGPINQETITLTDIGEKPSSAECKKKIKEQIVQKIRGMLSSGYSSWYSSSPQAPGWFSIYQYIRFISTRDWEFEIECCDKKGTASVKNWDGFPTLYGIKLFVDGKPDIWLTPPITANP